MTYLKFKGTTASLVQAAELLVMNSEPMASRVYCSIEDYLAAGFGRLVTTCFCIRVEDDVISLSDFDNNFSCYFSPYFKFELVPDEHVIPGFVRI